MVKDHLGKEYPTIKAMCDAYKINVRTYTSRLERGKTQEQALMSSVTPRKRVVPKEKCTLQTRVLTLEKQNKALRDEIATLKLDLEAERATKDDILQVCEETKAELKEKSRQLLITESRLKYTEDRLRDARKQLKVTVKPKKRRLAQLWNTTIGMRIGVLA